AEAPERVSASPQPPPSEDLPDEALAVLATNLWRATRRIRPDGSRDVPKEQRIAASHLQKAWDALEDAGVKIQDHDGAVFHPGMELDVLAYEPHPGTEVEVVLETVRPSVYRSGRCIQTGQVIVAQPEEARGDDARND
ncbi:MAG: hypothetical protein HOV94_29860, partial [Saccharothrix sp.]|nr:hypothetical protein [Saccharothrix sp.]